MDQKEKIKFLKQMGLSTSLAPLEEDSEKKRKVIPPKYRINKEELLKLNRLFNSDKEI